MAAIASRTRSAPLYSSFASAAVKAEARQELQEGIVGGLRVCPVALSFLCLVAGAARNRSERQTECISVRMKAIPLALQSRIGLLVAIEQGHRAWLAAVSDSRDRAPRETL